MTEKLTWGILSTGRIAGAFAKGVHDSETGNLMAVGSRTQESADKFGDEHGIERRYADYQDVLNDGDVEAVYIAPLHPFHSEWAIKAAEAGKHILCEKPLTQTYKRAVEVIEAAKRNDVFLMEAFMYRCQPQIQKLIDLIRDGAIGEVRMIRATFSFPCDFDPKSRIFDKSLGGGGILDVGCYTTSMARLVAGVATGKDFAEPVEVSAMGHLGDVSRVDEYTIANLRFPGDIFAQVATGTRVMQESDVDIFGMAGQITIPSPWFGAHEKGTSTLLVSRKGEESTEEIVLKTHPNIYATEADTVAAHIDKRQAPSPMMTWDDTLGNMKTLEQWCNAIGLTYPEGT